MNRIMPMLLKIALRPFSNAGVIFCTEKCGQEVRCVSGRTGKRDKIRTLDAREDFHELFGGRNGDDDCSEPSCEDEETFEPYA